MYHTCPPSGVWGAAQRSVVSVKTPDASLLDLIPDISRRILVIEILVRRLTESTCSTPGEILTGRQVAERLGVKLRTVREWRARGMPCHMLTERSIRYDWSEVSDWVASHRGER